MRALIVVGSLAVVLYLGFQWLRSTFDMRYMQYTTVDLEAARADNLLLGQYRASCTGEQVGAVSAYVVRPTTKNLGVLLVGTRIVVPDVATVRVGGLPDGARSGLLMFDDDAGVSLGVDGGDKPIRPIREDEASDVYGPNVDGCCFSHRSRVPERFWLTSSDGERQCEFTFDESTRQDVPPHTRWTW